MNHSLALLAVALAPAFAAEPPSLEDRARALVTALGKDDFAAASKDFDDAMNKAYEGRFGKEPPVRTTIDAAGGIPGNSLVEIDVIVCL